MKKFRVIQGCGLFVPVLLLAAAAWADVAADLEQAGELCKSGMYAEAEPVYRKVLETSKPGDMPAYRAAQMLPQVYLATDRVPQAQEAVTQLLTGFGSQKGLPAALHNLVDEAKSLKKTQQIRDIYQNILTDQPQHPQAVWLKMGIAIAAVHLGDSQGADAILQKLPAEHATEPRLGDAVNRIASAYQKLEQYDKARTLYQYVVDKWPKTNSGLAGQSGVVQCAIAVDDTAAAEAGIQKLLTDYAANLSLGLAVRTLGDQYRAKGKLQPARALYQYVVDKPLAPVEALWSQRTLVFCGIDANDTAATEAALQDLVTKFAENPRLPAMVMAVGQYYRGKGDPAHARQIYQQVLQRFPAGDQAVRAQGNVIVCSVDLKDDPAVEPGIQTLLTQFAQDRNLVAVVQDVANRLGSAREALRVQLYEYIVQQHPQHELAVMAQTKLCQIRIYRDDDRGAEALFQKILTDYPDHPRLASAVLLVGEAYYGRAVTRQRQGAAQAGPSPHIGPLHRQERPQPVLDDYRRAVETFEIIVRKLPEDTVDMPAAYHSAGECYSCLGETTKVLEYYQTVCDRWPNYRYAGHLQYMIGRLYQELYRTGAISRTDADTMTKGAYERLVRQVPDGAAARDAKDWLSSHREKEGVSR